MTSMTTWNPFDEMLTLRDAMQQLLAESVVRPSSASRMFMPLDLYETENGYVVQMAAPGLTAENFDVTLEQNVLTIRGEIAAQGGENVRYHLRELRSGSFGRSLQFPTPVNADAVEAHLQNGLLTIEVPKAEAARSRKIAITAS